MLVFQYLFEPKDHKEGLKNFIIKLSYASHKSQVSLKIINNHARIRLFKLSI